MAELDPAEMLRRGYTRETTIVRDPFGKWFDAGEPIEHPGVRRAFDGWIERAPDGRMCIRNSIHWVYADIQGPAYFVRGVEESAGVIWLLLSGARKTPLKLSSLRVSAADDSLWCTVFEDLPARFERGAAQSMADYLVEDRGEVVFLFSGERVVPNVTERPEEC